MPFRPKRPRGRHFADGSGWGHRYDRWEAARVHTPTLVASVTARDESAPAEPSPDLDLTPSGHSVPSAATPEVPAFEVAVVPGAEASAQEAFDQPTEVTLDTTDEHTEPAEGPAEEPTSEHPELVEPAEPAQPETREPTAQPKVGKATPRVSVARSSFVMFLGTFFSRFLGLVRSPILLGAVISTTAPASNAFDVANMLPNLIYMIVIGGLVNAVLVPAIVRASEHSDDDGAAFINKLLTLAIVFLGAATVLITLAAPYVVKAFAATMLPEWYDLTVAFAYWCLPQIFFYGMYTVLGQILNARENFGPYMWAPALNNVVAIFGMLIFLWSYGRFDWATADDVTVWTGDRIAVLGGFSTLGIVVQAAILIWPLRKLGIRFRPDFKWRGSGLGDAGRASWWVLLMMITGIIPSMIESNVAASATARAVSMGMDVQQVAGNATFSVANMIYALPTSLIVVSIATAMFTRLSRAAANGDMEAMRRDTSVTLRTVSTMMFLITAGIVVLATPLARLLALTIAPEEVVTLGRVVVAMSLGLVGVAAVTVLNRVFYAFEDTRKVFFMNLPFQILGLVGFGLSALLPPQWVVVGIGITMSVTNMGAAIVMTLFARKAMNGIDGRRLVVVHAKLAAIAAVTTAAGLAAMQFFRPMGVEANPLPAFGSLVVVGILMVAVYGLLMHLLKMEEWQLLIRPVRPILRRLGIK
ncbi:MAG: murein biosynthesis integral membrane protein MurJ [Ancrocorticia sp.]